MKVFDPNSEVTIKLNVEKINVVLAALGKLPLETSVVVWSDIKNQVESQLNSTPLEVVK